MALTEIQDIYCGPIFFSCQLHAFALIQKENNIKKLSRFYTTYYTVIMLSDSKVHKRYRKSAFIFYQLSF